MVRVLSLSFLGSLLCAAVFAAQPALQTEKASPLAGVVEESRAVFYRLPADSVQAARRSFVIQVSVNGRPLAAETFHLREGDGAPTVELFAFTPGLLDRLYEQARRPADALTVTVLLAGRAARQLTWGELLRSSRQTQNDPAFHPVTIPSEVKSSLGAVPSGPAKPVRAKTLIPDPDCSANCDAALDFCLNERCDPRGDDCTLCYVDYNNCIANCPMVCVDSTSDTTTHEQVGSTYLGNLGCYSSSKSPAGRYEFGLFQYTFKNTTTRTTHHCDGSTTSEVISVTYTTVNCNGRVGYCPLSSGSIFNEC